MATYTLFAAAALPAGSTFADAGGRTLGVEFYVTSSAWVTAIQWYRVDASQAVPTVGAIYVVSTGLKLTGTDVTFPAGTGWLTGTMAAPVALTTNTRYRAAGAAPGTNLPGQNNYWSTGAGSTNVVNGPLTGPSAANATGNLQGNYNLGSTLTFPNTGNASRARYGVDVTVTDVDPGGGLTGPRSLVLGQAVTQAANY